MRWPGLDCRSRQSERAAPAGRWSLSNVVRRRHPRTVHRRCGRAADVLEAADGSGQPELLVPDARAPESWSAAAQVMTYITLKGGTNYDVHAYSLRDRTSSPIAARPDAVEMSSRLSPDGRWVAYESTEAGPRDIFVEPFPQTGLRVRVAQGRRPVWSPDGKEIFFDRDDAQLYVVPITLGPSPTAGTATPLPIKGFLQGGGRRMYDITPDGKQFLMLFRSLAAAVVKRLRRL